MPPRRARVLSPAHLAFRAAVIVSLGAGFGNQIRWSASQGMPFIANLEVLANSPAFHGTDTSAVLLNTSRRTALERADGRWDAMAPTLATVAAASITELTAAFNEHLWPSRSQASTRAKHWVNWAVVVTWAIAWRAVHLILPMHANTLKALTWELLSLGTSRSVITGIWSAIQNRHRVAGMNTPITGAGEFSAWIRCLSSLVGRPSALLFPVHRNLVAAMLRWRTPCARDNRDRLMVALATICCLRVAELVALQVCDLWFDFHAGLGIRARDPELDIVHQLKQWLISAVLSTSPLCQKQTDPAARCAHCKPLFPRLQNGPGCTHVASDSPISPQMFGDALRRVLGACGADTRRFSGISARKGGLTTAITAGVTEEILFLQSGHSPSRAARHYMHLQDPTRLYDTFRAFGL
jgi:hypothetical protein